MSISRVESNGNKRDFDSLFRLDWDAEAVQAQIRRKAPELEPYMGELCGLRVMRTSDAAETFFSFLCTPNNNIARIRQMVGYLASKGTCIGEIDGKMMHRFPETRIIADIPESELRSRAFGYRSATIPSAAVQVLERGDGWIESLKAIPYEEAHRELCRIKGIGPKLADCISLFALDHPESVPIDTHIWQALTRIYRPEWSGMALTDARYREVSQSFRSRLGHHAGWAQQYLFYDNMVNSRRRRKEP